MGWHALPPIMPNTAAKGRSSVILIREWERQMSASGCCGRLEGDFLQRRGERCFPERRAVMEAMGPLYRDLRSRYGDEVEIHVVDPRNLFTIFALIIRDARAHSLSIWKALRTLFRIPVSGVVVNGRLLTRGRWPEFSELKEVLGDPRTKREEVSGGLA